ncbi:MAG: DUF3054 domain-containing protein, partial [Halobacteria archaeon]|nr:DUF3054 domain-containing protein [Halobacteria archaeon]
LFAGDVTVIVLFLLVGTLRHGVNPVSNPLYFVDTVAPFLIGWLASSFAIGLYKMGGLENLRGQLISVTSAWVVASVIGVVLRSSTLFHGTGNLIFGAVVTGIGIASLVVWRAVLFKARQLG